MTTTNNLENYIAYVKSSIDEKGIYPYPAWMFSQEDNLTVMAMDLPPTEVYLTILGQGKKENPKEVIFGIDRYNKDGQGIDMHYKSVFTIIHMNVSKKDLVIIAMPYNSASDIGELQYDNDWWNKAVSHEFVQSYVKFYGVPPDMQPLSKN